MVFVNVGVGWRTAIVWAAVRSMVVGPAGADVAAVKRAVFTRFVEDVVVDVMPEVFTRT